MARPHLVSLPSLDDLYAVEPEEFVAARTALAKQLKAAGDKDTAAEVTKLRRPPVSAWALNQVARRQPDEVEALLGAAADLAEALANPGGADLRATQRAFRSAIERTVRAALDVVAAGGRTPSAGVQQAVQATLQAAAVDEGIALALRAGVLAEDEPAPGFLFGAGPVPDRGSESVGAPVAPAPRPRPRPKPKVIGGRKQRPAPGVATERDPDPASASGSGPAASAADRAATRAQERSDTKAAAAERARAEAEEREAERRRRARLAELRTEAKRLEKRADRLANAAEQAEAVARSARADADEARDEADAVLAALDTAESTPD